MLLPKKTLEKLRDLITHETEYRTGPQLVSFFNQLGFNDIYGQGFPSRWKYAEEKLEFINGKPELDKCIRMVFAPVNFVGNFNKLDEHIKNFNKYLAFDGWQVLRKEKEITFIKGGVIEEESNVNLSEDEFLKKEFNEVTLDKLGLDSIVTEVLQSRLEEIRKCLNVKASLATIFLIGSTLEGILLGMASHKYPMKFNQAASAPKDNSGKVKQFHEWSLNSFIEAAYETGLLKEDVKKFK